MTIPSLWRVLGIEPTTDAIAIRRAYAARLKAVHPEDDPEGFKALRNAYEIALTWAKNSNAASISTILSMGSEEATPEADSAEPASQIIVRPAEVVRPAPPPAPEAATDYRAKITWLATLLAAPADPGPDALQAAVEAAIAASDHISAHIAVEAALARLAQTYAPRSDPFVIRITEHFRWASTRIDDSQLQETAAYCVQRSRDLAFLKRLRDGQGQRAPRPARVGETSPEFPFLKGFLRPGNVGRHQEPAGPGPARPPIA